LTRYTKHATVNDVCNQSYVLSCPEGSWAERAWAPEPIQPMKHAGYCRVNGRSIESGRIHSWTVIRSTISESPVPVANPGRPWETPERCWQVLDARGYLARRAGAGRLDGQKRIAAQRGFTRTRTLKARAPTHQRADRVQPSSGTSNRRSSSTLRTTSAVELRSGNCQGRTRSGFWWSAVPSVASTRALSDGMTYQGAVMDCALTTYSSLRAAARAIVIDESVTEGIWRRGLLT
jgi:hypothetical protein